MKTIKVKQFKVPVDFIGEVAEILNSNELLNQITGADDKHEFIFVEVHFEKGNKTQTNALHEIEGAIDDYEHESVGEDEDN